MASTSPEAKAAALRSAISEREIWLPVTGPSMGETIRSGDEVLLVSAPRPRLGEIWAFCDERGEIVVHRYLIRVGGRFRFQGDASTVVDRPVPATRLVGRVVQVRRRGRSVAGKGLESRMRGRAVALRRLGEHAAHLVARVVRR